MIPAEAVEAAANTPTAAERAMQDIQSLLDGWPGNGANEIDVLLRISRIVGRYDIEHIGEQ